MADAATAAAAAGATDAAGAADAANISKAGMNMSPGTEMTVNDDGTYTLEGTTESGHEWSKTFLDPSGTGQEVGHPNQEYVSKVKAKLSEGLGEGDELGKDANGDGTYKGKSLELGEGGRSVLLDDIIIMDLVDKGYSHEQAEGIARQRGQEHAVETYGQTTVDGWTDQSPKT